MNKKELFEQWLVARGYSFFPEEEWVGFQAGYDAAMREMAEMEPVGYVRAYGVECLQGTLMNETTNRIPLPSKTSIDPYPLADDDIPLISQPQIKG